MMKFETNDLLSKWGFGDGAILTNLLLDNQHPLSLSPHLLRFIARNHILPRLEQIVKVEDSCKMHNPIRAISVDGIEVDCSKNSLLLKPKYIEISDHIILEIIDSLEMDNGTEE
jgi:hypothetical protein